MISTSLSFYPPPHPSITLTEIQCGSALCPIDTCVLLTFPNGAAHQYGMPFMVTDVTINEVREYLPSEKLYKTLSKNQQDDHDANNEGDEDPYASRLRYKLGDAVSCRTSEDPIKGWSSGEIVQVKYREKTWPLGVYAPYKVRLDDGRCIFAPRDEPDVVRDRD